MQAVANSMRCRRFQASWATDGLLMGCCSLHICFFVDFYLRINFCHLGEVWDRARRLQEKMKTNMAMAQDRLDILGMYVIFYNTVSSTCDVDHNSLLAMILHHSSNTVFFSGTVAE